jgi:hypothetical protein
VLKECLKSILRGIKAYQDYSSINVANPVSDIHRFTVRQSPLNLHSHKKITHSCDYFLSLATYIYMRGQIYDTLWLTRKEK